ncbi:ubiquitin carboxyl-terminal hydrolase CYLD [Denticeps clupeoides]|uniref:ubiquitin carboxyl-terminal hydrolase CYLD n=1 Tax=Denticeps clupeoides TaxID=299321 RepID=UPI0010A54C08|nr:ubiquitin carboxyl-terminal hydrolase CYLD-like [Denticeps clupeoides]
MSGAPHHSRRRRPSRMYLVAADLKVQDQLDGPIRLLRGNLCQEQENGDRAGRSDQLWVKVLDNGLMVKVDKQALLEVPPDLANVLEPIGDMQSRLRLFEKPHRLQRLAALPLGSQVTVELGPDDLAEAELRYRGPLTTGSSAVYFGVQLKGWAVGRGSGNGSHKGHQLFTCPDGCALFVPAHQLLLRRYSRGGADPNPNPGPQNSASVLSRTAESAPATAASPSPLQPGQRGFFVHNSAPQWGKVMFCGPLASQSGPVMHVGLLLDNPVGSWDGVYNGRKLCSIPSPSFGHLLPISKFFPESESLSPAVTTPKSALKPPSQAALKVALQPPKSALKAPANKPPSPTQATPTTTLQPPLSQTKPLPLPPSPPSAALKPAPPSVNLKVALKPPPLPMAPNKPPVGAAPTGTDQSRAANGLPGPPSPPVAEEAELSSGLEVGSLVEVNDPPLYGVIRWIGYIRGIEELVAGIELDQELTAGTDGSYLSQRHFRCPANKGLFIKLRNCRRDSRFPAPETPINQVARCNSLVFKEWVSKRVDEHTPPVLGPAARELYRGWKKGIQGHLNSCYLDASLFSLFSCCSSVDWVLFRPLGPQDGARSREAQDLLRCEIVNPLRRYGYVCAIKTMALRKLLKEETTDGGFTNEEKDPEEFLNKLFQLLRVEPLLKIRSLSQEPQECHHFQLFPPSSSPSPSSPTPPPVPFSNSCLSPVPLGQMRVANVQTLLDASFIHSGLKFTEAPSCLPLLMPRFGKEFKMFDAILPSLTLDITDLLDEAVRRCSICQAVAEWECLQCYDDVDITPGSLKQFCRTCNTQVHTHKKRQTHRPGRLWQPKAPWDEPVFPARQRMELFAVTCIETSHYVSFVKHGPRPDDWLFFDSMADREGGENGFNVPHVRPCPEVGRYLDLSEEELRRVDPASLRDTVRRLLCDSYMCLYHCPQLSLYK